MKSVQALNFAFFILVPGSSWTVKIVGSLLCSYLECDYRLGYFATLQWQIRVCSVLAKLINPSGVNLDLDSFLTNWRESR